MNFRTEHDSMGPLQVPADALYQAQTQRAINNFQLHPATVPEALIRALLQIKQAAARANLQLGLLSPLQANAIATAAEQQLLQLDLRQYPVSLYQTGSGTSSHMNVNEVLATLASQSSATLIHPNDHVNLGQSSNDTVPSAIHLSASVAIILQLQPALLQLQQAISQLSSQQGHLLKTGRTHLMDAMPLRFSQVFSGWLAQLSHAGQQIAQQLPGLQQLAQGGSAIGTGVNVHPRFAGLLCAELTQITGIHFRPSDNYFFSLSCQDVAVACSGALKTLAVALLKIANDLRWMNSGPLAGLAEIELPALQPGSSMMPGKVNPVIPEAVAMASVQVIGHDCAITLAGQSGNFELNVMLPLVAHNLLDSLTLLTGSCTALADQAIAGLKIRQDTTTTVLSYNPMLVTALNPLIGYEQAAIIAKTAYSQHRPVLEVALELTDLPEAELRLLLDPARLAGPNGNDPASQQADPDRVR